jgi:hypothetical protein
LAARMRVLNLTFGSFATLSYARSVLSPLNWSCEERKKDDGGGESSCPYLLCASLEALSPAALAFELRNLVLCLD